MRKVFDFPISEIEVLEYLFSSQFNNGFAVDMAQFLIDPFITQIYMVDLLDNKKKYNNVELAKDLYAEFDFYDVEGFGLVSKEVAAKTYYEYSKKFSGFRRELLVSYEISRLNHNFISGCMKDQIYNKLFDYIVFVAELGRKSTEYN